MTSAAPTTRGPRRNRRVQVKRPNFGVFKDRPPEQIPSRGLQDCLNVRVKDGQIQNENMGWETFPIGSPVINTDSEQVLLIDQFFLRSGLQFLIVANRYDLFRFDDGVTQNLKYITPVYVTGTITAAVYAAGPDETTLTGAGTLWNTAPGDRNGSTNVIANDRISIGSATRNLQSDTWFTVKSVASDTSMVVDGDASAVFVGPNDPYTLRQRTTGDNFDIWVSDIFPAFDTGGGLHDHWYATNGVNEVVRWRGPTLDTFATRVNLGFTCKALRRFKNMMLYMNIEESGDFKPQSIRNSNVAEPENVTTGLASEFVPSEGVDPIVNAVPIGDTLAIYNERSVNILQFVGDPFVFVARTAVPNKGLVAPEAIVDFGDRHEFLSDDAAYAFNGVGIQEVGSQVFREMLRTISPSRRQKVITHLDEENAEAQWVIPRTTDNTGEDGGPLRAYTEHYTQPYQFESGRMVPFTIRALPATAFGYYDRTTTLTWDQVLSEWKNTNFRWNDRFFEAAFPFNLFGDENGYVFVLGTTDSRHDGVESSAIVSFIRTGLRAVMDGNRRGIIRRIEPFIAQRESATHEVLCLLYGMDQMHGNPVLLSAGLYDVSHAGERFVPFRNAARYAEVGFLSNGEQHQWSIDGWAIEAVLAGDR